MDLQSRLLAKRHSTAVFEPFQSFECVCLLQVRFLLPLPSGHLLCGGSGDCVSLIDTDLASAESLKIAGETSKDFAAATVLDPESSTIIAGTTNGSLCRIRLDIETRLGMGR